MCAIYNIDMSYPIFLPGPLCDLYLSSMLSKAKGECLDLTRGKEWTWCISMNIVLFGPYGICRAPKTEVRDALHICRTPNASKPIWIPLSIQTVPMSDLKMMTGVMDEVNSTVDSMWS